MGGPRSGPLAVQITQANPGMQHFYPILPSWEPLGNGRPYLYGLVCRPSGHERSVWLVSGQQGCYVLTYRCDIVAAATRRELVGKKITPLMLRQASILEPDPEPNGAILYMFRLSNGPYSGQE